MTRYLEIKLQPNLAERITARIFWMAVPEMTILREVEKMTFFLVVRTTTCCLVIRQLLG